ncbi:MAG: T9SS type A sorting domain-containing protein, partial [Saprospiraceae bacterium]
NFLIFPNPVDELLTIQLINLEDETVNLMISSIAGSLMISDLFLKVDRHLEKFKLPINNLRAGAYILTVIDRQGVKKSELFIKQ